MSLHLDTSELTKVKKKAPAHRWHHPPQRGYTVLPRVERSRGDRLYWSRWTVLSAPWYCIRYCTGHTMGICRVYPNRQPTGLPRLTGFRHTQQSPKHAFGRLVAIVYVYLHSRSFQCKEEGRAAPARSQPRLQDVAGSTHCRPAEALIQNILLWES